MFQGCDLCPTMMENCNHVILHCSVARASWQLLGNFYHVSCPLTGMQAMIHHRSSAMVHSYHTVLIASVACGVFGKIGMIEYLIRIGLPQFRLYVKRWWCLPWFRIGSVVWGLWQASNMIEYLIRIVLLQFRFYVRRRWCLPWWFRIGSVVAVTSTFIPSPQLVSWLPPPHGTAQVNLMLPYNLILQLQVM